MKTIQRIVRSVQPHWVGDGFPVRSLFSYGQGSDFDPFLLLDYGGPCEFPPSETIRGVEQHPHRGFETVTIVYQGELAHRDSSGSQGSIGPGDIQWMTAGSGIIHEEFHSERFSRAGGTLEMVQLWVNLPAKDKMSTPRYQAIIDAAVPRVELPDDAGIVRVIAGEFSETQGAASTFTPINVWDMQLRADRRVELPVPAGHTSLLIVQSGAVTAVQQNVRPGELVLFDRSQAADVISLGATEDARVLFLGGEPINEPVVGKGPFVMNTEEEISQAIWDYQSGVMGELRGSTGIQERYSLTTRTSPQLCPAHCKDSTEPVSVVN